MKAVAYGSVKKHVLCFRSTSERGSMIFWKITRVAISRCRPSCSDRAAIQRMLAEPLTPTTFPAHNRRLFNITPKGVFLCSCFFLMKVVFLKLTLLLLFLQVSSSIAGQETRVRLS